MNTLIAPKLNELSKQLQVLVVCFVYQVNTFYGNSLFAGMFVSLAPQT